MSLRRYKVVVSRNPQSLIRQIGVSASVPLCAFLLACLFNSAESGDRSGYGMAVLGMTLFASPVLFGVGALGFIFRRYIFGEICGGIFLFGAIFLGTLLVLG